MGIAWSIYKEFFLRSGSPDKHHGHCCGSGLRTLLPDLLKGLCSGCDTAGLQIMILPFINSHCLYQGHGGPEYRMGAFVLIWDDAGGWGGCVLI